MRDAAFACIRRIGVETGRLQHPVRHQPGRRRDGGHRDEPQGFPLERPRVEGDGLPDREDRRPPGRRATPWTRSRNDITGETPASFEPTIDYVVTKVPRWAFEKFPGTPEVLGTRMQSVGEAMAIGRSFPESLQKALRSLETGRAGLNCDPAEELYDALTDDELVAQSVGGDTGPAVPPRGGPAEGSTRRAAARATAASTRGSSTKLAVSAEERARLEALGSSGGPTPGATGAGPNGSGFPTRSSAYLWRVRRGGGALGKDWPAGCGPHSRRSTRARPSSPPGRLIITRPTRTPTRSRRRTSPKVVILGSGPNRIGQGVEFDYCCVQASFALHDAGFETVMVNCNPETVSTDYDTSDRLYFEPVTPRGRAERPGRRGGRRAPGRGDRGARRPDTAQAFFRNTRELGARHLPGVDRPGRGPGALERLCERLGIPQAGRRHGHVRGGGARHRGQGRLPGAGPPELRARGPGDGDRLRGRRPAPGDERA